MCKFQDLQIFVRTFKSTLGHYMKVSWEIRQSATKRKNNNNNNNDNWHVPECNDKLWNIAECDVNYFTNIIECTLILYCPRRVERTGGCKFRRNFDSPLLRFS